MALCLARGCVCCAHRRSPSCCCRHSAGGAGRVGDPARGDCAGSTHRHWQVRAQRTSAIAAASASDLLERAVWCTLPYCIKCHPGLRCCPATVCTAALARCTAASGARPTSPSSGCWTRRCRARWVVGLGLGAGGAWGGVGAPGAGLVQAILAARVRSKTLHPFPPSAPACLPRPLPPPPA